MQLIGPVENTRIRKLIRLLAVIIIVILLLTATGMLIGLLFGDKIKQLAVSELNKRLATEVVVNGSIDFSVLANFPSASIAFNDVVLKETFPEKKELLSCKKISLLFNVWDLLKGEYVMKKLVVKDGLLHIKIAKDGSGNYDIFKTTAEKSTTGFQLKIEQATLSGILILYDDEQSNMHFRFETYESMLSGDFSASDFLLDFESSLTSERLEIDSVDFLQNHEVNVSGTLGVHLADNQYTLQQSTINIENSIFNVSGKVEPKQNGTQTDLTIEGNSLQTQNLAALLPPKYAAQIAHLKSKGDLRFIATIKGFISGSNAPQVNIVFGIKNGTLSHDKMNVSFKSVNLEGEFSNGAAGNLSSSSLNLRSFSTLFDNNTVSGTMLLRNFNNPYLELQLNGEINLEEIKPLLPEEYITELKGSVNFRQCFFNGPVSQFATNQKINKFEAGGSFNFNDVVVGTGQVHYHHLNGDFDINNNQVTIRHLSFMANNSDLTITGNINNLAPYVLNALSDSIANTQKIGLNIQLSSRLLAWTDLIGDAPARVSSVSGDEFYSVPALFYVLTGSVSGNIGKFSYDHFSANDIRGKILFLGNTIYFNDFGLAAEKGTITANGKLDISTMKRNKLELTASLNQLDITQLFYEFNNFGQASLTDKNLKGSLTTDLALQATWDERKFNKSKFYAVADVTVDNGELNNFDPMLALAKFVRISELRNIRFSKLQNQVEIKNQKIYIPQMEIFSNALNLQLSGSHSFENIIDYKIQLNLLKLLTSKFEKSGSNVDSASERTLEGFLNLYLTMNGPADDPVIKYDKQAVKAKISADLKKEKNELKSVLQKEFDQQEQDQQQIKDWKAPPQIQYLDFETDSTQNADDETTPSLTKERQQKELDNFKKLFKPKDPVPK